MKLIMKKNIIFIVLFFIFTSNLISNSVVYVQDGDEKYWCPVCANSLKEHYKTSYIAKLQNARLRQYCSLECLVEDMNEYGLDMSYIKTIDAKTQKIIDAKRAFYVFNSKIRGTKSKISKFAFQNLKDAKEFKEKYGGKLVDFQKVLKYTQANLKNILKRIQTIRNKKTYYIGKNVFKQMCNQDLDPSDYIEINELKADIINKKLCKPLDKKHLQALVEYLWSLNSFNDNNLEKIELNDSQKCPVCGMFVYKYPRWATQIIYNVENKEHIFTFDGVKDMLKFYFQPNKWGKYSKFLDKNKIVKILVTDYYTQKAIEAREAFYVVGSDILGPMGNEFIPFSNEDDAKEFYMDHKGLKIIKFNNITQEDVYRLDGTN